MEWKDYASEIKEVLNLKGSPIAITYALKPPTNSEAGKEKYRVCNLFLAVRNGKIVDLTAENSLCGGGSWHLGLTEPYKGEKFRALQEFLVNGEKLYCSVAAFHRAMSMSVSPPLGLADHIVFSPLEKAEFKPDLVLFICNPYQASRLLCLDSYERGVSPKLELSGATCHQAVAYPIVTGELNISLMDFTSRKIQGYQPEDLLVSIPYPRFHGVMRSIEGSTAGRAKFVMPESFRHLSSLREEEME